MLFRSLAIPTGTQEFSGTITLSGAWALYPMAVKWGEEFSKLHPKVRVEVQAGGAGKGLADALAGIVDTNILNAMEAPRGIATFRKLWDLDGKDDRLLRELSASLQLGSAWYQPKKGVRMLCAPYVPIKWPLNDYDPYQNGVIIARDTLMKSQPSQGAETVGRLNYDIVNVRDWEVADRDAKVMQRWVKIRRDGTGRNR